MKQSVAAVPDQGWESPSNQTELIRDVWSRLPSDSLLLPLLESRAHRLLAEAGKQLEHVEPRRDRLRAVEEVDDLRLLLLDRLLDHEGQLLLRRGRELLMANAALHVQDFRPLVDLLADVHALPDAEGRSLLRHELEE